MTEPIKPDEVVRIKEQLFPDEVVEAFNEIIAERYVGGVASFRIEDVVKKMMKKGLNRAEILENHWLDVEGLYESAGWRVVYDQPGFNESYPATFSFFKEKTS